MSDKRYSCPECQVGHMDTVIEDYEQKWKGESVLIPSLEMEKCDSCGEIYFSMKSAKRIDEAVSKRKGERQ
jgi:YgiT-type zinc finger domain-containing protein